MAPRLNLPARQLRRTLQFLEEQLLVKHELVDDLSSGGSQNTKFWYIDYNMAVHVIRLRIHLLQTKLQSAELRARSSSLYICPGYKHQRCNGKYTETDAQRMVDTNSGRFLCRECVRAYTNHPNAPPVEEYTLQLVDNQVELKRAMDHLRRVNVQFSSKMESSGGGADGNNNQQQQQRPLRQGIFELLQKVRPIRGAEPITSNLPSENIAMGVGSKRLVGTGRTAKNLITKLVNRGIVSADGRHGQNGRRGGGGSNYYDTDELTFLKNAMGQEIAFELERGGGARANLLCTKGKIRTKLVDAAARSVGVDLGLVSRVIFEERERLKRKREEREKEDGDGKKKRKKKPKVQEFDFLQDNLGQNAWDGGLSREEKEKRRLAYLGGDEENSSDEEDFENMLATNILTDETDELRNLPENDFKAAFQQQYEMEVKRQIKLLGLKSLDDLVPSLEDDEDRSVDWIDG